MSLQDLSDGMENIPVHCVNYYDSTIPPPCKYSAVRIPNVGVPLNLDPNFLSCCDCEDDCSVSICVDRRQFELLQLTEHTEVDFVLFVLQRKAPIWIIFEYIQ